nr:hypothetical protein [Cytophagales bacterium]
MNYTASFAILVGCFLFITFEGPCQGLAFDYIIKKDSTRISGTIVRSFDFNKTTSITFVDRSGTKSEFGPKDILGFRLSNGRTFQSRFLPDSDRKEPVFFQLILRGRVSLLSYNSRFFVENEKEFLEITNAPSYREINGNVVMTRRKKYIRVLHYMLYGPCGLQLQEKIAKTQFTEVSLINVIMAYHDCGQYNFELLVEDIPAFRTSWVGAIGVSAFQSFATTEPSEIRHRTENVISPFVSIGFKLDQMRRMPRFSIDLALGYSRISNEIQAELDTHNHLYTATQKFVTSTVATPVYVNYMLFRTSESEYYVGAGANFRFNSSRTTSSIIDFRHKRELVEVELFERPIYTYSPLQFSPALKVGSHFRYKQKWGIISEFQVEYTDNGYGLSFGLGQETFNQLIASFTLGFRL